MKFKQFIVENALHLSCAMALVAMMGSLYFSEVMGFIPCNMCWYQRILMYPLVLLFGIAAIRKDGGIIYYTLPLTLLGIGFSSYHYILQKTAFLRESPIACGPVPCNAEYINWLGFITIPFLALTAFALLTVLQICMVRWRKAAK